VNPNSLKRLGRVGLAGPVFAVVLPLLGCDGKAAEANPQADLAASYPSQDRGRPTLDIGAIGYDQGDPNAPVKVVEISDFGCGYCRVFNQQTYPALYEEFIKTGKVQWKFVPFVLGMFPNGEEAALAGECAGEQGSEVFNGMRDRIFAEQTGWRNSEAPDQFFSRLAEEEGLDAGRFTECLMEARPAPKLQMNVRLGQALGVRGTPLFVLEGIPVSGAIPLENFRQVLDMLVSDSDGPSTDWLPPPPTGGGPSVPNQVLSLGMGYSLGPEDAPVNVVEFSDFGCGYCRVFQTQTLPVLVDEYVDTGLVRWTYVPYVLGIFPNGEQAALAGECAGEQGKFEPMRARLYEDQAGWRGADEPSAFFQRLADEEGLDAPMFARCMEGEEAASRVQDNTRLGQAGGIRGTPGFFVNGFPISGALPLDSFRDVIDLELSSLTAGR
jgi:protein-disulfide isomerase